MRAFRIEVLPSWRALPWRCLHDGKPDPYMYPELSRCPKCRAKAAYKSMAELLRAAKDARKTKWTGGGEWTPPGIRPWPVSHPKGKYYWTEEGWREFGKEMLRNIAATGTKWRLKIRRYRESDVVFRDRWQVVLLPER